MNLAELNALMARHGADATLAQAATAAAPGESVTMFSAMGQRMIPVTPSYDHEGEAATCECGLLLAALPRTTTLERVVVVLGKPRRVPYRMTHAHIAPGICAECWDGRECDVDHPTVMCDTPTPEMCGECGDAPAALGNELCRACARAQDGPQWDADAYYGLDG